MKKKIFTRGVSGLLAVLMCFTAMLGMSTNAFAATETAESYMISYPRDGDANTTYGADGWGHTAKTYMNGWKSQAGNFTTLHCMDSFDGKVCYCIEPGVTRNIGDTYSGLGEEFWNNYPSQYNNTIEPEEIKLLLGRIMQYGYQGNISTSWRSQNADDADKLAHAYATQLLVWETVVGERDSDFNHVSPGSYDAVKSVVGPNHPLRSKIFAYYDSMEASVQSHTELPSFMAKTANKAQNVELEWDGSKYVATLTDTNNVLSKFSFSANITGFDFSVSGNKLTISTADAPADGVTITASRSASRCGVLVWTDYKYGPDGGIQDTVTYTASASDPIKAYVKLKVSYGSAKIIKTSEDGKLDGISFTITGEGVNETVKTNSNGEITVDNLKPGTYTVTEQGYEKYEPQETRRVTVLAGQTATVSFNNVLRRGDLVVTKTSEDGLVEGVKFHLFGTSLSGIEVNEFAVTGKDGKAHFDDVLIGTGYTIEEIDTAVRYVVPANQTAAVEWNSVTNKSFSNVLKKFNVTVTKSDKEAGTAQGDASLAGAKYGIYKGNQLVDTYVTDQSGQFTTAYYVCGNDWSIREIEPSEGYLLDSNSYHVGAEADNYTVELNSAPTVDVFEQVIKGNMTIIKHTDDGETQIETPEEGAEFAVYLKSSGSYDAAKDNPKEDWLIFEDVHDPIIDRNTYNKVQKMLANTKHRAPKEENGPKSIFCDLLYCADCHKKMWYHTNTVNKDIHYFSCSNYVKDYRGTCLTRHYIRADSIATIVEMELRRLADYLVDDTERFAEILAKKSTKEWESEKKAAQGELTKAEMRIEMIPKLLKKLYEDNLSGKTSDDDYSILSQEYSVERDQLKKKILGLRDKLKGMEDRAGEREAFVKAIRKFMSMKTLTAPLLRELIDHIDVYEVEGQGKNKTQRVVIYYKFVGYLEIPNDLSRPTYSADLREGVSVEYITCEAGEDILDDEPEADK